MNILLGLEIRKFETIEKLEVDHIFRDLSGWPQ